MSVRVLLAKAMGQLLCIRAAPSLYLLASIYTMTGLDLVIVHKGCIEQGLADPGFEALESCICREVPIQLGKLFMEEHCFGGQARNKGL